LYIQKQGRHGKTDGSIRFSASNSFGAFITGLYKTAKSRPISTISPQPEPLWQTRGQRWIQRINSWGPVITGLKTSEIKADFDFISTTRAAMVKWMAELDSAHQIVGGLSSLD